MRIFATVLISLLIASTAHAGTHHRKSAETLKPTQSQLKALCSNCRIVTRVRTESHKGRSSGLGAVGGAVAGGLIGKKVGDSTVGTIGGAVVGGLVGNEAERRIKRRTVWIITTMTADGVTRTVQLDADPNLRTGDVVVSAGGGKGLKRN